MVLASQKVVLKMKRTKWNKITQIWLKNSIESFYLIRKVVYFLASTSGPSTLNCGYRYGPHKILKGGAAAQCKFSVGRGPKAAADPPRAHSGITECPPGPVPLGGLVWDEFREGSFKLPVIILISPYRHRDPVLVELFVVRIIRLGHPRGYPYGYPCKWWEGADIYTDILALWPFTWISSRISVRISSRISVSDYPCYRLALPEWWATWRARV